MFNSLLLTCALSIALSSSLLAQKIPILKGHCLYETLLDHSVKEEYTDRKAHGTFYLRPLYPDSLNLADSQYVPCGVYEYYESSSEPGYRLVFHCDGKTLIGTPGKFKQTIRRTQEFCEQLSDCHRPRYECMQAAMEAVLSHRVSHSNNRAFPPDCPP